MVIENIFTLNILKFFFFELLGFESKADTLSHSTSPFFVMDFFETESQKLFICLP
jgi:hypothetical protein